MKPVVIYKSQYGSTEKYAQWSAEALSCRLYEKEEINAETLAQFDTIIYIGGLYAGGMSGIEMLKNSCELLKDKYVILFTCGIAYTENEANTAHIDKTAVRALPDKFGKKGNVPPARQVRRYTPPLTSPVG